jgi:hypothetical protein
MWIKRGSILGWNRSRIGVKAYRIPTNELIFEYDLSLFTGVTADYIVHAAKFFKQAVDASTDFKP